MKKTVLLILGMVVATTILFAQTPEAFKYQAVARNASGEALVNQNISLEISILETASAIYTEEHSVTTNQFGLFSLNIGEGISSLGNFSTIDWSTGVYSVQISIDENGGTSYTLMGTSPLLTVPYAMHAKTADNVFSGYYGDLSGTPDLTNFDTDVNDDFSGDYADLSNSPSIPTNTSDLNNDSGFITNADDADADATNELQDLSEVLSISNDAGLSQIKNIADPTNDNDAVTKQYVDELKQQIIDLQVATGLIIQDIDDNTYNVVTIGTQIWLAENLRTSRFNDGSEISNIMDNTAWMNAATPAYCWYDNDSAQFSADYGALYNWYAVSSGNLCPLGWHMPTDVEWKTLEMFLGMSQADADNANSRGTDEGGKLKESDLDHWQYPNLGASNESGFTALPGGMRSNVNGGFYGISENGYFWTSDEYSSDNIFYRRVDADYSTIYRKALMHYESGASVRCIKD